MSEFVVQPSGDGGYHVVQYQPVVGAECQDEAMAITIAGMLNGQTDATAAPAEAASQETTPDEAPSELTDHTWTTAELEVAFERLRAGEKLKAVSAAMGKPDLWGSLRAHWAAHQRNQKEKQPAPPKPAPVALPVPYPGKMLPVPLGQTPYSMAVTAIADLKAQAACATCGRHFKPTPDRLDRCARCAADV